MNKEFYTDFVWKNAHQLRKEALYKYEEQFKNDESLDIMQFTELGRKIAYLKEIERAYQATKLEADREF